MTFIPMTHPETGGVARTSEEAFKMVWEPRGWERADPVNVLVGEVLGIDVTSMGDLSKEQLLEAAAALGVAGSARSTKAELEEAIRAGVTPIVEAEAAPAEPAAEPDAAPAEPADEPAEQPEPSTATRPSHKGR